MFMGYNTYYYKDISYLKLIFKFKPIKKFQ